MISHLPATRANRRVLLGRFAGAATATAALLATASPLAAQVGADPIMPYGSPLGSGAGGGQSSQSSVPIPPSNTNPTPSTIYQPIAINGAATFYTDNRDLQGTSVEDLTAGVTTRILEPAFVDIDRQINMVPLGAGILILLIALALEAYPLRPLVVEARLADAAA